jgi:hypothetical protein
VVVLLRLAGEDANRELGGAQRVHDMCPDEAGSPGDEDHSLAKFFQ